MAMVIRGRVSVKLVGLLKHKNLPGEWGVLFDGKGGKPPYIELYSEQGASSSVVHVLVLEQVKFSDKTFQQGEPFFNLSIRKEKHQLKFGHVSEKDDWVQSLCHVSSELWAQRASSFQSSDLRVRVEAGGEDVMNENILYDSCEKVQQFKVSVCPTRASTANSLQGNYILNPTENALRLLEVDSLKSLHDWPYKQIRKYGRTRNNFKMEVGRKCTTGEGEFEFFAPDGALLVEQISSLVKQAKENMNKQSDEKQGVGRSVSNGLSCENEAQSSPQLQPPRAPVFADSGKPDLPVPRSKLTPSPSNTSERDTDSEGSDLGDNPYHSKDKRFSDKDRKAAAKLKKKQEKEKEKERKEIEKKLKGSKGKAKGAQMAAQEGNIYDELGDVGAGDDVSPPGASSSDRNARSVPQQRMEPVGESEVYSLPQKPPKDGWKKRGRSEQEHIHTENYQSMKEACDSQPHQPATPFSPHGPHPGFGAEEDTYHHLGGVSRQTSENVYGMASAKDTISSVRMAPIGAGDEYENASDHYPRKPSRQVVPEFGDYADVS